MSYILKLIEKLNLNDRNTDLVNHYFFDLNNQLTEIFYGKPTHKIHSKIFGSYSRNTNIFTQNINILFELPSEMIESNVCPCRLMTENIKNYQIYNDEQSKFLNVATEDSISFSILPVLPNIDGTYTYKVSKQSGLWSIMDPVAENIAFKSFYREYNYSPISMSKIVKLWLQTYGIDISGYLSDTLVYYFFKQYSPNDIMYMSPEAVFKLFIKYLIKQSKTKLFWKAPGSEHNVPKTDNFHEQAEICLEMIEARHEQAWQEIFELSLISA